MSELTLEEQQFLDECQKAGVPDEFRDKWLKRYFAALDNNNPFIENLKFLEFTRQTSK